MKKRKKFAAAVSNVLSSRRKQQSRNETKSGDSTSDVNDSCEWPSDFSSFDEEEDAEEGIYAGIDDEFAASQNKDDNVDLTSLPASHR